MPQGTRQYAMKSSNFWMDRSRLSYAGRTTKALSNGAIPKLNFLVSGRISIVALPIPAPLVGEGIPSPNSQFWCGESLPLPNFLKLPLVRGGQSEASKIGEGSTNKQCKQCSTPARTPEAHRDVQRVEQLQDSDCFLTLWRPQPPNA